MRRRLNTGFVRLLQGTVLGLVAGHASAQALPFLMPGDSALRSNVEALSEAGETPLTTTWPLPSLDIKAERRDEMRGYNQPGSALDAGWYLSGASHPTKLRTFADTPRETAEAGVQSGWTAGDYAGGAIRFGYALHPSDEMHYRLDGTYAAWRFGNWWTSIGQVDRWWGPGWDGSLLLSSNARSIPGLALDRASSTPFSSKWLSWIGPWRLSLFLDHMESRRADFGNTLLYGDRFTFSPVHGLEIGLARTAEFCGTTRPCGVSTFFDMLTARSNRKYNPIIDNTGAIDLTLQKKSAQRSAIDLKWRPGSLPAAVYWQQYGEVFDSGNLRPRQLTELFGIESTQLATGLGRLRLFLEYANTACGAIGFNGQDKPTYGCAYEKDTWHAGYRYRGRAIGDSMDRDGIRWTVGGVLIDEKGHTFNLRLRHFDLNRDGIAQAGLLPHTVTTVEEKLYNTEFSVDGFHGTLRYSLGLGADYGGPVADPARWSGRGFLSLSQNW